MPPAMGQSIWKSETTPLPLPHQDHAITHYPQIVTKLGKIDQGGWQAECSDGRLIRADLVLLATGNPPPQWPCPIHGEMAQLPKLENRLVQNPWNGQWLDHLPAQSRLAIVGGGLTTLDAVTALARRDHQGSVFLLAPHGSLPPEQADWVKQAPPSWPEAPRPSKILRRFRSYLPDLPPENPVWQQAFEELRIDINQQWQAVLVMLLQRVKFHSPACGWRHDLPVRLAS